MRTKTLDIRDDDRSRRKSTQIDVKRSVHAVAAGAFVLFLAAPVGRAQSDTTVSARANTGLVQGTLRVKNDDTHWRLNLRDNKADNEALYLEVIVDVETGRDRVFRSGNTSGGKTLPFEGDTHHSGTRGAYINICQAKPGGSDPCKRAAYVSQQ
jgi:hypothetical protein